ncbi:MAG: FHA domain-containing protein [Anaerolineae bacterium]|nr:FHA domain-containing protein [Anaerolineae bacterium]
MYDNEPTMMGHGRPAASLVVRQGSQAGMSFSITGNQVIIGREEGLDIILQDPESSRRHSRISWQGGQYVIEDLGSTNGTFVNGVQITTPQILNPGDSIGIGQTALVFQMSGAQPGAYPYQAPPQQAPVYAMPSGAAPARESKTTQYLLYGCGCLLLLGICILVALAALVLLAPGLVEDFTGLDISLNLMHTYLNTV